MREVRSYPPDKFAAFKADSDEWNAAADRRRVRPGEQGPPLGGAPRGWRKLPHADRMHPVGGGEHFMPLIVCTGAAERRRKGQVLQGSVLGVGYLYVLLGRGAKVE